MAGNLTPNATLYAGRIAHVRHSPFRYRFDYRLWMLCIDLDCLDAVAAASKVFAHNGFGLTAINDKDHGFRDGTKLRGYAVSALAREGLGQFGAKILFMATPSVLGYAFNPISFYFCHDAAGRLGAILHQVKNTFGDQIGYLMPVAEQNAVIRQSAPKRMHVSPFFDMQGGYRFALTRPEKKFTVSIQYGAEVKRLTATMKLQARPFSDSALLRLLLQMPLTPMKVMAAIHWQALKLFLRGARFHAAPAEKHLPIVAGKPE
jgi:DUF1365 family protein